MSEFSEALARKFMGQAQAKEGVYPIPTQFLDSEGNNVTLKKLGLVDSPKGILELGVNVLSFTRVAIASHGGEPTLRIEYSDGWGKPTTSTRPITSETPSDLMTLRGKVLTEYDYTANLIAD